MSMPWLLLSATPLGQREPRAYRRLRASARALGPPVDSGPPSVGSDDSSVAKAIAARQLGRKSKGSRAGFRPVALQIGRRRKFHLSDEPEQRTIACPLPAKITIETLPAIDLLVLTRRRRGLGILVAPIEDVWSILVDPTASSATCPA
jgi:hypothetical protein